MARTSPLSLIHIYAIAEDGSFTADGEGGAQLEGDININFEGIDVVLAGLYLSTRGMVNVEGADSVTYYGTTQDDVIDMTVRNVTDSVKVDTGKGDDRVDVRAEKRPNLEFAIELEDVYKRQVQGRRHHPSGGTLLAGGQAGHVPPVGAHSRRQDRRWKGGCVICRTRTAHAVVSR